MPRLVTALAIVLSLVPGCDGGREPTGARSRSATPPAASPSASCDAERPPRRARSSDFDPPTLVAGGRTHLRVTFLDGTNATLTYPRDLRLTKEGVYLDTTGGEPGEMIGPRISYGGVDLRLSPAPVRCVHTADGSRAGVWGHSDGDVLVLRFGRWFVSVFERHTDLDLWAEHLRGRVTRDGWLVLRGDRHLEIGPEKSVGDTSLMLGDLSPGVLLWPLRCRARDDTPFDVAAGRGVDSPAGKSAFASWCDRSASMAVHVYGSAPYIRRLARNLRIEDVELGHPLGRYRIIP